MTNKEKNFKQVQTEQSIKDIKRKYQFLIMSGVEEREAFISSFFDPIHSDDILNWFEDLLKEESESDLKIRFHITLAK